MASGPHAVGRARRTATSAASTPCARCRRRWTPLEGTSTRSATTQVAAFLAIQEREARWWRDACVLYFQTFSKLQIPAGYERPERTLDELMAINSRYVPGI